MWCLQRELITNVSDSNKGAVEGRAPLQFTSAFEEETEKSIATGILPPEKLTKDGNPAVVVQTESWCNTYGTQFFAVDQVNGIIYAKQDDGQWERIKEKATIDANTHNMSTTPIAGSKITSQGIGIDTTPGNRIEQKLP